MSLYECASSSWPSDYDPQGSDQAWKAGTADSNDSSIGCSFSPSGACFTDRKLAAVRAYHEWMPIRQVDVDDKLRTIWRNFQIGKLLVRSESVALGVVQRTLTPLLGSDNVGYSYASLCIAYGSSLSI